MSMWKLVSGILSIVLFFVIEFQSCAVGVSNAMENSGGTSGTFGMLVGILLLVGGIVAIVTRGSGKGGNIALIILFGLAALLGFIGYDNYADLKIWSYWALINMIFAVVALIKVQKSRVQPGKSEKVSNSDTDV